MMLRIDPKRLKRDPATGRWRAVAVASINGGLIGSFTGEGDEALDAWIEVNNKAQKALNDYLVAR